MNLACRLTSLSLLLVMSISVSGAVSSYADDRPRNQAGSDPRDDASIWGVGSGEEWLSAFPKFDPLLKEAGVQWLRGFYEWQALQPKEGVWNWTLTDRLVADARANNIHVTAGFAFLASWASADGGTRRFPIRDIKYWRSYVDGLVTRYHDDIKYWEVWNEFNGSFSENGSPQIYAELVREASIAAKKIDPTAKIGLSVANFDVGYLDSVIKAGAAGYFDYICVHPYEKLDGLSQNGEISFLSMTSTLRQMLKANNQPIDTPLWITEIGSQAPVAPNIEGDARQAVAVLKTYILSIVAGFQRVFWFEARGPAYDQGKDFGLIRDDFSLRPSYVALKNLHDLLGAEPSSAGWIDLHGGYGFLFRTGQNYILAAWAPDQQAISYKFETEVHIAGIDGKQQVLPAGSEFHLSNIPTFVTDVPSSLVTEALANRGKLFAWSGSVLQSKTLSVGLGKTNVDAGLQQVKSETTVAEQDATGTWRRPNFSRGDGEGRYIYFSAAGQALKYGHKSFQITAVVRRSAPNKDAGMNLFYESQKGYVRSSYYTIPPDADWHELKWRVSDANFVGAWGWNFRLDAVSSPNDFLVREIRVEEMPD